MNIQMVRPRGVSDWLRLYRLYRKAFPPSERKPFGIILKMEKRGATDVWCLYRDGVFCAMATTVNADDLVLLDYFAVVQSCRGEGIGSAALELLLEHYREVGLFVEIESTREACPDHTLRCRRRRFYERAGLNALGVTARVFGVEMELLGIRCSLDFEGYRSFYRDHYSPWAAEHIERI